jgi:hypothetical protein
METAEISFCLSPSDLRALERYQRRRGAGRWHFWLVATGVPLVLLAENTGGGAIIVPPSAFAGPRQEAAFRDQLRALWQARRQAEGRPPPRSSCG